MNEYLKATVELHCYLVNCGKPCSSIAIQHRYDDEVSKITKINGCKIYFELLAPDWTTIWIYKKDFMIEVIKALPDKPQTIFDHWVLGKAFGYSDEAIEGFLASPKRGTVAFSTRGQSV